VKTIAAMITTLALLAALTSSVQAQPPEFPGIIGAANNGLLRV
jgi:hypothetical protein